MEHKAPDFLASVSYISTELGGRSNPAKSGYRPMVKFERIENMTSGQQILVGSDWVNPGQTIETEITLAWHEAFRHKLFKGQRFEFYEYPTLIGTGTILKVFNKELERLD